LISEVASRSGVPAKTLRYYEDIGLLEAPSRTESGYRNYDERILARLAFIRSAQAIGLSLGEIRSIVSLRDDGKTPCGHVLELLRHRSAEIDRAIRELRALKGELNRLVERAQELDPTDCDPSRVCHLIGAT
jgi:DNA-binding transcriptional MerR regulator